MHIVPSIHQAFSDRPQHERIGSRVWPKVSMGEQNFHALCIQQAQNVADHLVLLFVKHVAARGQAQTLIE